MIMTVPVQKNYYKSNPSPATLLASKKNSRSSFLRFGSNQSTSPDFSTLHDYYNTELSNSLQAIDKKKFADAVKMIETTKGGKGTVWIAGNGGSAAIAEHMAHNLTWDCSCDLPDSQKIKSLALNAQSCEMTARANDVNADFMFATMLDNVAKKDDVFVAISASGESTNIVKALTLAKKKGIKTIAIAKENSSAVKMADVGIGIRSKDQQVIEDVSDILKHQMVRALNVDLAGKPDEDLRKEIAHRGRKDLVQRYTKACTFDNFTNFRQGFVANA